MNAIQSSGKIDSRAFVGASTAASPGARREPGVEIRAVDELDLHGLVGAHRRDIGPADLELAGAGGLDNQNARFLAHDAAGDPVPVDERVRIREL